MRVSEDVPCGRPNRFGRKRVIAARPVNAYPNGCRFETSFAAASVGWGWSCRDVNWAATYRLLTDPPDYFYCLGRSCGPIFNGAS